MELANRRVAERDHGAAVVQNDVGALLGHRGLNPAHGGERSTDQADGVGAFGEVLDDLVTLALGDDECRCAAAAANENVTPAPAIDHVARTDDLDNVGLVVARCVVVIAEDDQVVGVVSKRVGLPKLHRVDAG